MPIYHWAFLKLNRNHIYPIVKIHEKTNQITLEEAPNVWNTVRLNDVTLLSDSEYQAYIKNDLHIGSSRKNSSL